MSETKSATAFRSLRSAARVLIGMLTAVALMGQAQESQACQTTCLDTPCLDPDCCPSAQGFSCCGVSPNEVCCGPNEICYNGSCVNCDDGIACTDDSFENGACVHAPNCGQCERCNPSTGQCQDPSYPDWLSVDRTEVCVGCTVGVTVHAQPDERDCGYDLMLGPGEGGVLAASDRCDPDLLPETSQSLPMAPCCIPTTVYPSPFYPCPPYDAGRIYDCFGDSTEICARPVICEDPTIFVENQNGAHFKLDEGQTRTFNVVATQCGSCWSAAGLRVNGPWEIYSAPCVIKVKDRLLRMTFDNQPLSVCTGPVTATAVPYCPDTITGFNWSFTPIGGEASTSDINLTSLSSRTCMITLVNPEKVTATAIKVRATPVNPEDCCDPYIEAYLEVEASGDNTGGGGSGGCGGCSGCGGGAGRDDVAGVGCGSNDSVNVRISLGRNAEGKSAGKLYFLKEVPTSPLVAAKDLGISASADVTIRPVERDQKEIRQIKFPDGLAEIVPDSLFDQGDFTVSFYTNEAVNDQDADGIYTLTDIPYRQWRFEGLSDLVLQVNDNYKLDYQENEAAITYHYTYQGQEGAEGWTLLKKNRAGAVLQKITHFLDDFTDPDIIARTYTVLDGQDNTVYMRKNEHDATTNQLIRKTEYSGSSELVTDYDRPSGQEFAVTGPDGRWEYSQYDAQGKKLLTVLGHGTKPNPITDAVGHAYVYEYTAVDDPCDGEFDGLDDLSIEPLKPRTVTEKIGGAIVARTYYIHYQTQDEWGEIIEQDANPTSGNGFCQPGNPRTCILKFPRNYTESYKRALPYLVYHPDGTIAEYGYAKGGYTLSPERTPSGLSGTGDFIETRVVRGWSYGYGDSVHQVHRKSTTTVTITDPGGRLVQEETYVYTNPGGDQRIGWTLWEYDAQGRLIHVYRHNAANETTDYTESTCCGNWTTTGPDGVQTSYVLDGLRRVYQQVKGGVDAVTHDGHIYDIQPAVTATYGFDAVGRVLSTATSAGSGADARTQITGTSYDWLGRPIVSTDAAGIHTSYHYAYPTGGGRIDTIRRFVQNPADPYATGVPEATETYPDGRVKSVTGAGVVERHYAYGVEPISLTVVIGGTNQPLSNVPCQTTTVKTGPPPAQGPDNRPWTKTWTDPLGRTVCEDRPAYEDTPSGAFLSTFSIYNDKGQLVRTEYVHGGTTNKFLADTVYEYDNLGNQFRSGMDLDISNALEAESTDRYQETEVEYVPIGDYWWHETRSYTFATDNSPTRTWTGTTRERLTGPAPSGGQVLVSETDSEDIHQNHTVSKRIYLTLSDGTIAVRQETDVPDSEYPQLSVSRNGLLQYTTSTSNLKTSFKCDALGQRIEVKDPRHQYPAVTQYEVDGQGVTTGRVLFQGQQVDVNGGQPVYANAATYAYYPYTGRLKSVTRTVGNPPVDVIQYLAYDDQGRQTHVWGNGTYPVLYGYDAYGRRETMSTYRGGTNWNTETLPGDFTSAHADVTTWDYDDATGLLESKTDDLSKAVTYTYYPEGKLKTRKWARDASAVTTYYYDPNTGEMTSIDYPGTDTPDLTFSYTRLGRHDEITDGLGKHVFTYNTALQLDSEQIADIDQDHQALYEKTTTRDYQGNTAEGELAGRDAGFHIGSEYDVNYYYDNAGTGSQLTGTGRFWNVGGPGISYRVFYGRVSNSDLIASLAYNPSPPNIMTYYSYEANRDLREAVGNLIYYSPYTFVSGYQYVNDTLGRRTNVIRTGRAVDDTAPYDDEGFTEDFGYNKRNELETTDRFLWTSGGGKGSRLTTYGEYDYAYDNIGNRLRHHLDDPELDDPTTYDADDLNRYTWVQLPSPDPREYLCYDEDGNLIRDGKTSATCPGTDGLREFKWDAENRLIEVVPVGPSNDPPRNKKVKFVYDYMGRRVEKAVYTYNNGWPENPGEVQRFVYDGWNIVLVLDGNNVTRRKYTWGLDLSGTIHGAGGIGGLLAAVETQGTTTEADDQRYWFMYDANGNVGQVLDATNTSNITIAAHYEYDPYGNVINSSGAYADTNPIRFSTKWYDVETDMYYYGYRYYLPRLGRWGSQDPIGESGGKHLLAFVTNDPVDTLEPLGLSPQPVETADQARKLCDKEIVEYEEMISKGPWYRPCQGGREDEIRCEIAIKVLFLTKEKKTEKLRKIWDQFSDKTCPRPKIRCNDCEDHIGGAFFPSPYSRRDGFIRICWNNVKDDEKRLIGVLIHEGVHALQHCYRKRKDADCARSLREELETYYCEGLCTDFASCMPYAIGSACGGHCKKAEQITDRLFDELKEYLAKSKDKFCTFPREPDFPTPSKPSTQPTKPSSRCGCSGR